MQSKREKILKNFIHNNAVKPMEETELSLKQQAKKDNDSISKILKKELNISQSVIFKTLEYFNEDDIHKIFLLKCISGADPRTLDKIEKNKKSYEKTYDEFIKKLIETKKKIEETPIKNAIICMTRTKGNSIFKKLPRELINKIAIETRHRSLSEENAEKIAYEVK